jgi:transposase
MRGADTLHESLFSISKLDDFIPTVHPLRPIREMVNQALGQMNALFQGMYAHEYKGGRPSIAPEKLLRAMLLQILYSVRSERMLMEQIQYNMLFRWFVGLAIDDAVWVPTVFTKNRERLIEHNAIIELFNQVLDIANDKNLLSSEHFSVDGTLIQAWAGHKSFVAKDKVSQLGTPANADSVEPDSVKPDSVKPDSAKQSSDDSRPPGSPSPAVTSNTALSPRNETDSFKGEPRSNATHQSTTDIDARLYCKGDNASKLRYMGHALIENRNGLVVNGMATIVDGYCEREAAKAMINDAVQVHDYPRPQITLGADKGYDAKAFVDACIKDIGVVPHVAQNNSNRTSSVPNEIAQTDGYAISMNKRKIVEQVFGWSKMVGALRQVMLRGLAKVDLKVMLTFTAFNLTKMRRLMGWTGKVRLAMG